MTDFEILGPLLISGMAEDGNLKFGMWLDYVRYILADDKLPPKQCLARSGEDFSN